MFDRIDTESRKRAQIQAQANDTGFDPWKDLNIDGRRLEAAQ